MIKLRINNQGVEEYISLEECLVKFHQKPPEGWFKYIEGWVNEGLDIKSEEEYNEYSKHSYILEHFDYKSVQELYKNLKQSIYNDMFNDDILRYIAHIYGLGYFERAGFEIDIRNPDLNKFLNTKDVFKSYYVRSQLKEFERYSLMDLLPLKYGMNAIRRELLFSSKW
jgi:hypothetical protein